VALTSIKITQNILGLTVAGARVLARTNESLYLSNDAGVTWKPVPLLLATSSIYDIALGSRKDEPLLLATTQGIYRNEPGTSRWEHISSGLQEGTVSSVAWAGSDEPAAWCVQFGRLFRSLNNGRSWNELPGTALENATIRKIWTDPASDKRILAVTPDLGVFYME
jgi:photosystem II stability/assembly factor-like uncharacterized protein